MRQHGDVDRSGGALPADCPDRHIDLVQGEMVGCKLVQGIFVRLENLDRFLHLARGPSAHAFDRELLEKQEGRIEIVTPLIAMRKTDIVRLGLELDAPFDLTWSCYSREDRACGICDSCALRLRAFAAAGELDPIPYATK